MPAVRRGSPPRATESVRQRGWLGREAATRGDHDMTFEVAIPSHDRIERLQRQTLRMLADGGVGRERITIFVDVPELDHYKAKLDPGLYGQIEPGGSRMRDQYAAMEANYDEGTRILCIDDDIKSIQQM